MRKEQLTSYVATSNITHKYIAKNQSFLNQFVNWFRNFVENAE
jgi:hypothetical protein